MIVSGPIAVHYYIIIIIKFYILRIGMHLFYHLHYIIIGSLQDNYLIGQKKMISTQSNFPMHTRNTYLNIIDM